MSRNQDITIPYRHGNSYLKDLSLSQSRSPASEPEIRKHKSHYSSPSVLGSESSNPCKSCKRTGTKCYQDEEDDLGRCRSCSRLEIDCVTDQVNVSKQTQNAEEYSGSSRSMHAPPLLRPSLLLKPMVRRTYTEVQETSTHVASGSARKGGYVPKELPSELSPAQLEALYRRAVAYRQRHKSERAIALLEGVLALQDEILANDDADLMVTRSHLGAAYQQRGETEKAIEHLEPVLAVRERLARGQNLAIADAWLLHDRMWLGAAYLTNDYVVQAVKVLDAYAVPVEENHLRDNKLLLETKRLLAYAYIGCGQMAKAKEILEALVVAMEGDWKFPIHSYLLHTHYSLAITYTNTGQVARGREILENLALVMRRTLAEDHPFLCWTECSLADIYQTSGQLEAAIELLESVVAMNERRLAEYDEQRLTSEYLLAMAYLEAKRPISAVPLLQHSLAVKYKALPWADPSLSTLQEALVKASSMIEDNKEQATGMPEDQPLHQPIESSLSEAAVASSLQQNPSPILSDGVRNRASLCDMAKEVANSQDLQDANDTDTCIDDGPCQDSLLHISESSDASPMSTYSASDSGDPDLEDYIEPTQLQHLVDMVMCMLDNHDSHAARPSITSALEDQTESSAPPGTEECRDSEASDGRYKPDNTGASGENSRKRSRDQSQASGSNDGNEHGNKSRKMKLKLGSGTSGKRFACPYNKYKPFIYTTNDKTGTLFEPCATRFFADMKSVYEHLKRRHYENPRQCPRCGHCFVEDEDGFRDHGRTEVQCSLIEYVVILYTSPMAIERIKLDLRNQGLTRSEDEIKWNFLYSKLFNEEPSSSPYGEDERVAILSRVETLVIQAIHSFRVSRSLESSSDFNDFVALVPQIFHSFRQSQDMPTSDRRVLQRDEIRFRVDGNAAADEGSVTQLTTTTRPGQPILDEPTGDDDTMVPHLRLPSVPSLTGRNQFPIGELVPSQRGEPATEVMAATQHEYQGLGGVAMSTHIDASLSDPLLIGASTDFNLPGEFSESSARWDDDFSLETHDWGFTNDEMFSVPTKA